MKTYIVAHVHEPQRYWNRELQDWRRDRQDATVYTESERVASLQYEVRGKFGFLPAGGCWVVATKPCCGGTDGHADPFCSKLDLTESLEPIDEAELQSAMAATSYLDDPRSQQ